MAENAAICRSAHSWDPPTLDRLLPKFLECPLEELDDLYTREMIESKVINKRWTTLQTVARIQKEKDEIKGQIESTYYLHPSWKKLSNAQLKALRKTIALNSRKLLARSQKLARSQSAADRLNVIAGVLDQKIQSIQKMRKSFESIQARLDHMTKNMPGIGRALNDVLPPINGLVPEIPPKTK